MLQSIKKRLRPSREKIYIVPTKAGAFFVVSTFVMLLVGSGYSNNLINLLAFFMFSLVFVGMVLTQVQLKKVQVADIECAPAFADSTLSASALLLNENTSERWGLVATLPELTKGDLVLHHLRARQSHRVVWQQKAGKRGLHRLKKIELYSVFPLGLFYAWKVLPVSTEYWVYPKLAGDLPIPSQSKTGEASSTARVAVSGGDDFRGHRKFSSGDSYRHVDWKAHARGRPLLIKEINEGEPPDWVLDWSSLDSFQISDEEKLSQMAVWVEEAYRRDLNFMMKLPSGPALSGRGTAHAKRCFERLALYE